MTAYLTVNEFKLFSVMPQAEIDALETAAPGWLDKQLALESSRLDSRLRKRYAVPFTAPVPVVVQGWLADIVTVSAYMRRGVDPLDPQFALYLEDAKTALDEILESANSSESFFDLPLREGLAASGILNRPRTYSEQSPYVFSDSQSETARQEDRSRGGTSGT